MNFLTIVKAQGLAPEVVEITAAESFAAKLTDIIIQPLINILAIVAVAVFLWGLVVFLSNFDSPEVAKEGKTYISLGLIGLFVIFAAHGIVKLIKTDGNAILSADISNVSELHA